MKKAILLVYMLTFSNVFAAEANSGKMVCTPTIGVGDLNYNDSVTGLNRIHSMEVTSGEAGGIKINLSGTSGTGQTKASSTINLALAYTFDPLTTYSNANFKKNNVANPYVRFEMESSNNSNQILAALTFSTLKDAKLNQLLTSRYSCEFK